MTRRLSLIGLLFLLLMAGGFALWLAFAPPASAINRANALRIKPGMTLAEVEAILGGPARYEDGLEIVDGCIRNNQPCLLLKAADEGRYLVRSGEPDMESAGPDVTVDPGQMLGWFSRTTCVSVFLVNGKVAFVCRCRVEPDEEGLLDGITKMLKRWFEGV